MARMNSGAGWRPNANEAPVMANFNGDVAGVGAIGAVGWGWLRALARRLGLPVREAAPPEGLVVASACPRCGAPVLVGEAACVSCGRAAPQAAGAGAGAVVDEAAGRRRTDLVLAGATGVVVGVGTWLLAQTMERSYLQLFALQLWWLAGLFWGGFVLLVRSWLDQ